MLVVKLSHNSTNCVVVTLLHNRQEGGKASQQLNNPDTQQLHSLSPPDSYQGRHTRIHAGLHSALGDL